MMQALSKIEVTRRLLGTALSLYLEDRDPVSVHTLACAAAEVADVLIESAGGTPFRLFRTKESGREITDSEYFAIRNAYANAFKHASRRDGKPRADADLLASFNDLENDERLFIAWFDYGRAAHAHPVESHVFQAWFLALHPSKLMGTDEGQALRRDLEIEFPNLPTLPRDRQKRRLRRSIEKARRNREMMADPKVDRRPLIL